MAGRTKSGAAERKTARKNDPERTRQDILEVATEEFATHGLSGARVDEIAARTATTKRMIYYYFGSKEGLYAAVLEEMYGGIRDAEQALDLESLDPVAAMRRLVEVTFDYHAAHPEFVRMVAGGEHSQRPAPAAGAFRRSTAPMSALIRTLRWAARPRGERAGAFRARVDAIDLQLLDQQLLLLPRLQLPHLGEAIFRRDLTAPEQSRVAPDDDPGGGKRGEGWRRRSGRLRP